MSSFRIVLKGWKLQFNNGGMLIFWHCMECAVFGLPAGSPRLERFLLILNRWGIPTGAILWFPRDQEDRFMPAPLSPDIRNRFQVLHREGLSAREIGRRLLISAATAVRFADRLRRTGDLAPAVNSRRQGHGRLVPYEGFFAELVEQDPDITLKELQAALLEAHGVQASLSGIDVVLRRLDLTYKKRASSRMSGANPM